MPYAIIVPRVEMFRDMFNITQPLVPGEGALNAPPLDVKLVQYLLKCWATGADHEPSTNRLEAARIVSQPDFVDGVYSRRTLRVLQLFETEFDLPGDGVIHPLPLQPKSTGYLSPVEYFRSKLGMLNCYFLHQVNRYGTGRKFDEIRKEIAKVMPRDLAETLYPKLAPPSTLRKIRPVDRSITM